MKEVWKDINGYEGKYEISNLGRIRSLKNNCGNNRKEPLILKQSTDKRGYLRVGLSKNNKQKLFLMHRLVAQAFIPNLKNLPQVNHKDENKQNNNVINLEWCNNKYNINYGTRKEKISEKFGRKILQFDLNGNFISEWNGTCKASRELKINEGNIWECCNKKRKTAGKYFWKYKED